MIIGPTFHPGRNNRTARGSLPYLVIAREEYSLLQELGAIERPPTLDALFTKPDAWAALSLRNMYA